MLKSSTNSNAIFLEGLKSRDYTLINEGINLGAPYYDKSSYAHALLFKSWHRLIQFGDMGLIELVYNAYPFQPSHDFNNLLTSIISNNKECFDFFLKKCIQKKVDLNNNFGILLSNACKASPICTYEDNFKQLFVSDYYLSQLLHHHINLNITTTHPLVILADNNNFHSWKLLYLKVKSLDTYSFNDYKKHIIHSFYKFLNNNQFMSNEVQFFFQEFDKKLMYTQGLKKISHPSYRGHDIDLFCIEMFSQEPQLFIEKSKNLGKNNHEFSSVIQKIIMFDTMNHHLTCNNNSIKVNKI